MRGAHNHIGVLHHNHRIIPADAGSTTRAYSGQSGSPDHPRGCGEHRGQSPIRLLITGSSPRMRGAQDPRLGREWTDRIIPADAGSTLSHRVWLRCRADHPRGCGEHRSSCHLPVCSYGSSPRMRGAHRTGRHRPKAVGIIPADAGSTLPKCRR